jgi:hypothetical protein
VLKLPQVTLCCVDAKNHALALRALVRSRRGIEFARSIFLTDAVPQTVAASHGIEVISISAITSREAYSRIILKGLRRHIQTSHVLLTSGTATSSILRAGRANFETVTISARRGRTGTAAIRWEMAGSRCDRGSSSPRCRMRAFNL